jgi:hypothetical protein
MCPGVARTFGFACQTRSRSAAGAVSSRGSVVWLVLGDHVPVPFEPMLLCKHPNRDTHTHIPPRQLPPCHHCIGTQDAFQQSWHRRAACPLSPGLQGQMMKIACPGMQSVRSDCFIHFLFCYASSRKNCNAQSNLIFATVIILSHGGSQVLPVAVSSILPFPAPNPSLPNNLFSSHLLDDVFPAHEVTPIHCSTTTA